MVTQLKKFFMDRSYQEMVTNQDQIVVLYQANGVHVDVLVMNEMESGIEFTKEQYEHILSQIEHSYYARGYHEVHLLSLLCTKNIERVREFCFDTAYASWIIDERENRLIIYENQQSSFHGLQQQLEGFLAENSVGNNIKSAFMNWRSYPFVTIGLIVLNVLIFVLVELTGSSEDTYHLYEWGGSEYHAIVNSKEYYRLLMSMFLHAGSEHLLNNMFVLAVIGERLEKLLGTARYIAVYFGTGILASIGSVLYNHWMGEAVVGVGASGAIFGVIGGVFYLIWRYRGAQTGITANRMILFIILSLYSGVSNASSVDNTAHVVGCISGILITCLLDRMGSKRRIRRNK